MKAYVHSEMLKAAVTSVARFLMPRSPLEAHGCVRIEMTPTTLSFMAFNNSNSMGESEIAHGNEDAPDDSSARVDAVERYVRGDVFTKAAAACVGDVTFEITDKFVLLSCSAANYKIPTVFPDTIPKLPVMNQGGSMVCDSKWLKHALAVCGPVGEDCGITVDVDGSVMLFGTRGDSFLAIAKLGEPGIIAKPPLVLFNKEGASLLAGGCIGENVRLSSDERFACVESSSEGLFLRTQVARTAGKEARLKMIRRLEISNQTTIQCAGDLAKAMSRASVVSEAESMLCDISVSNSEIVVATRTSTGEATTKCPSSCGEGSWAACINASQAAMMLRPFSQTEPMDIYLGSLQGEPLALRMVQGAIEVFMAQATSVPA